MNKEKKIKNSDQKQMEKLKKSLIKIEKELSQIKKLLFGNGIDEELKNLDTKNAQNFIEGIFNGETMIDKAQKKYEVPANYASKSKLVAGDTLKLVIASNGTYVYKQIAPIPRKKIVGILEQSADKYKVKSEDKYYNVLSASITYFKAKPGDKLTIIVPRDKEADWAAVENKIA